MSRPKGYKHSKETCLIISEKAKANPVGFAINPHKYGGLNAHHERIRVPRITKICPECKIKFQTKQGKYEKKYCSRPCHMKNSGGYRPGSTKVHRVIYNGIQMDSGAESIFAQLLHQHNIKWVKNRKKYFLFVDPKGKTRKYFPDFYLPDYDFWVEIKGKRYIREDDNLRLASVGNNIQLIMSNSIELPSCIL